MKKFLHFIKKPPFSFGLIIYLISFITIFISVAFIFLDVGIINYIIDALAMLLLTYTIYLSIVYTRGLKQNLVEKTKNYEFINKLLCEHGFRAIIFTTISFIINIGYALFEGITGIISASTWHGALAIYYIILCLTRGIIIFRHHKSQKQISVSEAELIQAKTYRNCGILIMFITLALLGAIIQTIYSNKGFHYEGNLIYASALYTFYKLTISIINIIKVRKSQDFILQSIRNLSFASALVSIFGLQTAMFYAFSPNLDNKVANAITGAVVIMIIFILCLVMIIRGSLKIKNINKKAKLSNS